MCAWAESTRRCIRPEPSCSRSLSFQLLFPPDVSGSQDTHCVMSLVPLSPRGAPVQLSRRWLVHNPRAIAALPDPAAAGTLLVQGQSIPHREQHEARQGQAAQMAVVTHPCAEPVGLQERGPWFLDLGSPAEGCEYTRPSFGSEHPRCGSSSQQAGAVGWELWMAVGLPRQEERVARWS